MGVMSITIAIFILRMIGHLLVAKFSLGQDTLTCQTYICLLDLVTRSV